MMVIRGKVKMLKSYLFKKKEDDDDPWAKKKPPIEYSATHGTVYRPPREEIHYAGFWTRVAAAIIDTIIYVPFYYGLQYLFPTPQFLADGIFTVFALVTYTWWFASPYRGSPGMRVMKFHICDMEGNRITHLRSFMWGITGTIGWLFAGAGLFYIMTKYDVQAISEYMNSDDVKHNGLDPVKLQDVFGTSVQEYMFWTAVAIGSFFVICLIWSLSIALSKQKAGFHNILCATRFVMDEKPKNKEVKD